MRKDDDLPKAFTQRFETEELPDSGEASAESLERSRNFRQRAKTTGIYVNHFLDDTERPTFEKLITTLHADFEFNCSSDLMQVELVAVYFLRLARAQKVGDFDAAQKLDQMIRSHLRDLKTTKLAREGDQPARPETTPAEWATRVLESSGSRLEDEPPLDREEADEIAAASGKRKKDDR